MSDSSQAWFGWIPTNRGQIEFSYIGLPDDLAGLLEIVNTDHIQFKRIHLDYLSDTLSFAKDSDYNNLRMQKFKLNLE